MSGSTIFVIDDQHETCDLVEEALRAPGRTIVTFDDPTKALAAAKDRCVDLVLTDLRMPQKSGLEVLKEIKADSAETDVILMTGFADVEQAVLAMKKGAVDFFVKPLRIVELSLVVERIIEYRSMRRRLNELPGRGFTPVGSSKAMSRVLSMARAAAETDASVLILGETGAGKEVLADYIQRHSARAQGPYIKVDCSPLPETLLESELFGHEKGAFTGAFERRLGRFERAHLGTLFLDEIAEIPMSVQLKLLRVLQSREIERIGGTRPLPVDFRLICATHRDIEAMVREGKFREDLYYRIHVFPIHNPPLRERLEDLPALAYNFLRRLKSKQGRAPVEISRCAIEKLQQHHWPGNIRELENTLERACVLTRVAVLTAEDLVIQGPHPSWKGNGHSAPAPLWADPQALALHEPSDACPAVPAERPSESAHIPIDLESPNLLEDAEKATMKFVLEREGWNFVQAALTLNISRSTLYKRASQYGLRRG